LGTDWDLLEWDYGTPNALQGDLGADAFVIWWEDVDTTDPRHCVALLPVSARSWGHFVPGTYTRSYAISAVRFCASAAEESTKQQVSAWRGVT
jgi:hypothetical protein